jgi:hypothetical protein
MRYYPLKKRFFNADCFTRHPKWHPNAQKKQVSDGTAERGIGLIFFDKTVKCV